MKNFITGLMTLFNSTPGGSHYSFYDDVQGRMYQVKAPPHTSLSDGDYACFQLLNNVDEDTFTENMVYIYPQFSLYSGTDGTTAVLDMDSHLSDMIKDKVWLMTGATVVYSLRRQGEGPINVPADVEAGTEEYWLMMADYEILINRD